MAKVISAVETVAVESVESTKMVEIKHTRVMQDADGNDVTVLDWTETKTVDEAISQCEAHKANLEAQLAECDSEMADYIAIRDAE
jgi:type II secretory pathway component PulC